MVVSMDRWVGKVAVVTGASTGIGEGIAEALVNAGMKVAGLARRKEKIEELARRLDGKRGKLYAVKADLRNEEDILNAFNWVKKNLGPIHVLINNAGYKGETSLIDGDSETWRSTLELNVLGLSIATREAVKDMRENKVDGHIVHINSIAGHKVPNFPYFHVYPASKFAVTALTETLRNELNSVGSKIKITSLSPGVVSTEMAKNALASDVIPQEMQEKFKEMIVLEPEDIADAAIYVLSTPPHVQVHELQVLPIHQEL